MKQRDLIIIIAAIILVGLLIISGMSNFNISIPNDDSSGSNITTTHQQSNYNYPQNDVNDNSNDNPTTSDTNIEEPNIQTNSS